MNVKTDMLREIDTDRLDMPLLESGGWHDIVTAIHSQSRVTPSFHLTYLTRQEATWFVEPDRSLFVQAGQLALIQPGHSHHGAWSIDHPNQHFWFYLRPEAAAATRHTPFTQAWLSYAQSVLAEQGHRVIRAPAHMEALCQALLTQMESPGEQQIFWLRTLIAQIFLVSIEAFAASDSQTVMDGIVSEIDARLLEWSDISAVAAAFAMGTAQFHRRFKQKTGMNPWNYILRARCRLACHYLQTSELSITALSHELGFCSSQYFSTVFRRFLGQSPSAFRTANAQEEKGVRRALARQLE